MGDQHCGKSRPVHAPRPLALCGTMLPTSGSRRPTCCGHVRRELRLGPPIATPALASEQYELRVELTWLRVAPGPPGHAAERTRHTNEVFMEGGVVGIAWELAGVATDHGLTVTVPESRQYIMLLRN